MTNTETQKQNIEANLVTVNPVNRKQELPNLKRRQNS